MHKTYTLFKKVILYFLSIIIFTTQTYAQEAPPNPSQLLLKALSPTSVSLHWQDNANDETGFKIYRDGQLITTTKENITSYIDRDLSPNTTYTYTVKSTNDALSPFHQIQQLIQHSAQGLKDVTYICVGDSTRAGSLSPFDNPPSPYDGGHIFDAILEALSGYGVDAYLYAKYGQEAKQFHLATRSPTWRDVVEIIPGDGNTTIVDISLGINDLWSEENDYDATVDDIKRDIQGAITKILTRKPHTLFMLTMPNRKYSPYNISSSDRESTILREAYLQLSEQMHIPLVNVIDEIMPNHDTLDASWYQDDNIHYHLTPLGQQLISDLILSKLL